MRFRTSLIPALAAILLFANPVPFAAQTVEAPQVSQLDPENTLIIELKTGKVVIAMLPDVAPKHVAQIKELARSGQYDNVVFHRVIDGFMAQTGDVEFGDRQDGYNPRRAGTGGSALPDLPAEFNAVPFDRGTVGMARSQNPNSANSQFFIMFAEGHFLNNNYTVWGRVVEGMEHVDQITKGEPPADPDAMISVRVGADVPAQ